MTGRRRPDLHAVLTKRQDACGLRARIHVYELNDKRGRGDSAGRAGKRCFDETKVGAPRSERVDTTKGSIICTGVRRAKRALTSVSTL